MPLGTTTLGGHAGLGWAWPGLSALSAREPAQGGPDVGGEIGAEPAVR